MNRKIRALIRNNIKLRTGIVDERGLTVGDKAKMACIIERVNKRLFDNHKAGDFKYIFGKQNIFCVLTKLIDNNYCENKKQGLLLIQQYFEEINYTI